MVRHSRLCVKDNHRNDIPIERKVMTKVNLTVTKNLEDVPGEVEKQINTATENVRNTLRNLKCLESSLSIGLPFDKIAEQFQKEIANLQSLNLLYQDIYNICMSFSQIEESKIVEQKNKEIEEKLKSEITSYKFQTEAKIGQMLSNEELYKKTIQELKKQLAEKETPVKKTPKIKTVKKK